MRYQVQSEFQIIDGTGAILLACEPGDVIDEDNLIVGDIEADWRSLAASPDLLRLLK